MLNETPLTIQGQKTPKVQIYKSESHKLHQAFAVKLTEAGTPEVIVKGQPTKLNTDGTISAYTGTGVYLGIAVTDSINPAYGAQRNYPVEVTVMVRGFAVVNMVAAAAQNAGYVTPTSTLLNNRFVTAGASSGGAVTNFIAITPATAANDVIQVIAQ